MLHDSERIILRIEALLKMAEERSLNTKNNYKEAKRLIGVLASDDILAMSKEVKSWRN